MEDKRQQDCEAAGHDCSNCASGDGHGGCSGHSHEEGHDCGPRTIEEYLELTYKQNQLIVVKLEKYAQDLKKVGKDEVAAQLMNAIPEFEKGNMWISLAKSMLI